MIAAIELEPALRPVVRIGALWCEAERVAEHDAALDVPLAEAAADGRAATAADTAPARALYKAIGLDPTRTRPSSEALLRRVRRGEPLPRVNTLVDVANWCSLEYQLPYGLYDADRVTPPVTVRRGAAGEAYPGIRKDTVHLEGRLAVCDASGPFGNPTSDSGRTMVTTGTRRVLAVVFAPAAVGPQRMLAVLDTTAARLRQYAGGRETARWVS